MQNLGKMQSLCLGIAAGLQSIGVPEIRRVEASDGQNCGVSGDWFFERRTPVIK